jgi:adenylosuccinate lyase
MIERYTHSEMTPIWSTASRYRVWWEVESEVMRELSRQKILPFGLDELERALKNVKLNVEAILGLEAKTQHDVIAFVDHVSPQMGPLGKWLHYGLTSSDVVDTAFSLQIQRASRVVLGEARSVLASLDRLIQTHGTRWMMGRTHGMNAQPQTLEQVFALWGVHLAEAVQNWIRHVKQACVAKLSGAVGNYPFISPAVEAKVAKSLGLTPCAIASQVVGRHLHAQVLCSMAVMMGVVEKIAVDLRHHHRSGIEEMQEGFASGQKGSSAMPHKQNPIACENLTGLARMLRCYAGAALENIALWMERDISHSSVERVIFPDAFELCAYGLKRLSGVLTHLRIHPKNLQAHLDEARQVFYSQAVQLRHLRVAKDRTESYNQVQELSFQAKEQNQDFLVLAQSKLAQVDLSGLSLDLWNPYPGQATQRFQKIKHEVDHAEI